MAKILVIEDEMDIRENLLECLEIEDYETLSAENGAIGVEIALTHSPDLIICDIMMPDLDGYGVLEALRQVPKTEMIPFIFLTALADKTSTRKGMELGADDYLSKPCTPEELLNAVRSRLRKQNIITQRSQKQLEELRSNISQALPHELRTPLNGILGYSDLLLMDFESLDSADVREMLQEIQQSGERLYRVIQNFLRYAELELIACQPERIAQLRQESISCAASYITAQAQKQAYRAKRGQDLLLQLEDGSIAIASLDLGKIIEELLSNALKFSEPGTPITLKSWQEDGHYIFTVSDQGRGMTPEQITQIGAMMQFERKLYEQQGSGLGLSIVQRLVQLYGGKLTINSTPQKETTVQVMLPYSSNVN
ncbi:response regulator [Spirulina sp. CS-785/01]|uniref:hybrid sensor histidine kinase/response regulator n=1 Tax=Spirulina sp. CS-785/01 TaxID=3021716 RepID=UPI0023302268|nr:response regulator [Spirulina sp. CS-785/01]MDB9313488.1 response regulator [Spirulina sp. CS-785/01]